MICKKEVALTSNGSGLLIKQIKLGKGNDMQKNK